MIRRKERIKTVSVKRIGKKNWSCECESRNLR